MGLSVTGSGAGREQVVGVNAAATSETVPSATLASPKQLIGALGNLGRAAWAALPTTGARGPQFAYASSSGDEKLPAQGFFPGISAEEIMKTEEEGGEVQEHQLPVLEEERDSRLNRQVPGESAVRAFAPGAQQAVERTRPNGVAQRGVEETRPGDGSIFDRAIGAAGLRWAAAGDAAQEAGLSDEEAIEAANKAIGISDPQANFSAGGHPAAERTRPNGVAQRGVEETHPGDGSIYDKVIDVTAERFWGAVGAAEESGASESEARAAGDQALGKTDPQANFSVRRPVLSSLAAALRLNRPLSEQVPDAGHRPRPMLHPRLA